MQAGGGGGGGGGNKRLHVQAGGGTNFSGGGAYISEKFVPGGTNLKMDQIDCDRSLYSRFYGKLLVKTLIS